MPQIESQRQSDEFTLGRRIASRRALLGIDRRSLADALGVTPQAVSQYERDQRSPNPSMLSALSRALRVSVDWLLHGDSVSAA
jgi:transcriptional regulator with XRE-family HTH domain